MRSTFKVLFYLKKSRLTADGYPVMCRITVNGTQTNFQLQNDCPGRVLGYGGESTEEIEESAYHRD